MAHYLMGNFETAALMFRERVQLVRDTDVGRAWLAAALGQTGEIDAARETWAELIAINPDFSIHSRLARLRLADPGHVQMMLDGLAKADLAPAP
ncbi:hypothetical protein ACFMPD_00655 [Sedimentitalea sp. HM32M-2]|uniref:hypothetical protein n=1 Tax=Sedimentitalea sp. HM32M-2 TaxID=3351566 RepID=UPI00362C4584